MAESTSQRIIVCPHDVRCSVTFTAERCAGAIAVSIDEIGCSQCGATLAEGNGAAAEYRQLLVRNYITRAL